MIQHVSKKRVFWIGSLNDHFPTLFPSSSTPTYLDNQLKCPLVGAKVREMHHAIGIKHTHQVDPAKIKSFRHHLCAYQDVCSTLFKIFQDRFISTPGTCGVKVHSANRGIREMHF